MKNKINAIQNFKNLRLSILHTYGSLTWCKKSKKINKIILRNGEVMGSYVGKLCIFWCSCNGFVFLCKFFLSQSMNNFIHFFFQKSYDNRMCIITGKYLHLPLGSNELEVCMIKLTNDQCTKVKRQKNMR